jgi:hypothetical protein
MNTSGIETKNNSLMVLNLFVNFIKISKNKNKVYK